MAIGTSEKLAQEGLRGNRDRLAEGKRVGSCVRKIAHDLERMRGAGSLLRQYQTDQWVRMVNTKLTDRSEWYKLLTMRQRIAPSFFCRQLKRAKGENGMGKPHEHENRDAAHAFPFYGGELLNKMGAAWFVSYAYHEHVDPTHENWNRTATASGRMRRYKTTFSYHRYWLDKVMTMSDQNLAKNTIGLTPRQIKDMANAVMSENW